MLIFSILSYVKFYNVTSNEYYFLADSFDFEKDATFEITIQSFRNYSLIVGLATLQVIEGILSKIDLVQGLQCNETLQYCGFQHSALMDFNENMTQKYTGVISSAEVLQPIILSCSTLNQSTYNETQTFVNEINETEFRLNLLLTIKFANPISFCESHPALFLIVPPIVLSLYCLIFLLWIINWIMNFTLKNCLHIYYSLTFLLTFGYMVSYASDYALLGHSKSSTTASESRTVFLYMNLPFWAISIYISASLGPCFINYRYRFEKYIFVYISAIYSIPYLVVQLKWNNHSKSWFNFCIAVIFFKAVEFIFFNLLAFKPELFDCLGIIWILLIFFFMFTYVFLFAETKYPLKYILETACNWVILFYMALLLYYFKLNKLNRKGYYYTADKIEIEIEDNHYDEIDNKPKKNWQKEKEEVCERDSVLAPNEQNPNL